MKLRDTVILVVVAHVGLVLIWVCMGGCANNKAAEPKEQVASVSPGGMETELPPAATEVSSEEPATPIAVEEAAALPGVNLPELQETAPAPAAEATTAEQSEEITVTVKKGDTLWGLSRRYHVPVSVIVDRNDIQNAALIREGRELIIPAGAPAVEAPEPEAELPAAPTGETAAALPGGTEAIPVAEEAESSVHTVQPGETIWILARRYHTTSKKIMETNNITDPTKLQVGQELRIPKGE